MNDRIIDMVKSLSTKSEFEQVILSFTEYSQLMNELWESDEYLKKKYVCASSIPRIYSLFGVQISIK